LHDMIGHYGQRWQPKETLATEASNLITF